MTINQLLNSNVFHLYENIAQTLQDIKESSDAFDIKKNKVKSLYENNRNELQKHNDLVKGFTESFIKKYELPDHLIYARINSPTPYGAQPKDYLWSGISLEEDKSFSFQYSWVFQSDKLEITFCFGAGQSTSGKISKEEKSNREMKLENLANKLAHIINKPNNRTIIEKLIEEEGFLFTSEWLKDGKTSKDLNEFIQHLENSSGAKSGITKYFQKDELLEDGFDLETKIYTYFEMFRPIWEQLRDDDGNETQPIEHQKESLNIEEDGGEEEQLQSLSYQEVITHIDAYIRGKGFYFTKEEITNFFLSLKTKPFVILSGISGTGKSKIVKLFAESIGATEDNGQFTLIPVRPDWSDGSDLLGYTDIKGDFKEGPLTKIVRRASQNPTKPYIVLLDEMNLARVEYYFSDILSVMESRAWEDGEITTSNLLTEEMIGENLKLPSNIYMVGTVNMDETTHPFSKKVLDRANTIEFNRVELGHLDFLLDVEEKEPVLLNQEVLEANFLHLKDVYSVHPDLVHKVTEELVKINDILQLIHAQVGYRVRDEICMYLAYNQEDELIDFNVAFDHCLLQKILPRIAGSDSRVSEVLNRLIEICAFNISEDDEETVELTYATYPRSAEKLLEMRRRLVDGFTSFWIS